MLNKKLNFIREMNEEVNRLMEDEESNGDLMSYPQSMSNTIKKSGKKPKAGPQIEPMISVETMLINQLSAAKMTEQLISDLQTTQN